MMKSASPRRASASIVSAGGGVLHAIYEILSRRPSALPVCPSCGLPVGTNDQAFMYRGLVLHQDCLGPSR